MRSLAFQICRYGASGGVAAVTHLGVLILLVEAAGAPETPASAVGFACATPINYLLQHRFVFRSSRHHAAALPRYLCITLATLALNTAVFWCLADLLGIFYVASQMLTIGIVVPVNFVLNRSVTFARPAAEAR